MSSCSQCGQVQEDSSSRCHHCGSLNLKIDDILAKEAAEAEQKSFKGKLKSILYADNKIQAFLLQLNTAKQSLSKEGWFTIFVIFAFIFMMTYAVI